MNMSDIHHVCLSVDGTNSDIYSPLYLHTSLLCRLWSVVGRVGREEGVGYIGLVLTGLPGFSFIKYNYIYVETSGFAASARPNSRFATVALHI